MKKQLAFKVVSMFLLIAVFTSAMVFLPSNAASTPLLKVHMLAYGDKGNDSFIIELPNSQNMIIDVQDKPTLMAELSRLGIQGVKYVIGTHKHEDHIGGMNNFLADTSININNTEIYYPKGSVNANGDHYNWMVQEANQRGLSVKKLVQNDYLLDTIVDGKTLRVRVLSPANSKVDGGTDDYVDSNDASLVLRIVYGSQSILLMSDAREQTENDMLNSGYSFMSDVIKVGHHGRKAYQDTWGATDAFLDYVQPTKALITNSKNEIDLPVVNNLQERNITYWSTGQYGVLGGHVTLTTDGTSDWTSPDEPYWPSSLPQTPYYFIERNTANKWIGNNQESNGDDVTMTDKTLWFKYNLRWEMIDAGGGYYYFENMESKKRLAAPANGSDVYVVSNTDTSDNVKWLLTDIDGTWKYIDHKASGMRLYSSSTESWLVRLAPAGTTGYTVQWKLNLAPYGS